MRKGPSRDEEIFADADDGCGGCALWWRGGGSRGSHGDGARRHASARPAARRRRLAALLPPSFLPDAAASLHELETALAAAEAAQAAPPEDHSEQSGRRQWFADLGLGWAGPRRWRRAAWKLLSEVELASTLTLRRQVEAAVADVGSAHAAPGEDDSGLVERYNSALVNRCASGAAGIKWHADDERWYCVQQRKKSDIRIASVSLGAERWFEVRRRRRGNPEEKRKVRIRLRSGSLLVMAGACQEHWQHALPRDDECETIRYNLTFRRVLTADEDPTLNSVHAD